MSDANSSQPKPNPLPDQDVIPTQSVAIESTTSRPAGTPRSPSERESSVNSNRSSDPKVGRRFGTYEILRKLGQGGMGAVYLARHSMLDKLVALKVLPPNQTSDSATVLRFEREMRAVARISHPNVVQALDAGYIDGLPYLVMEYVRGVDLSTLIPRRGPLPVCDACTLIRQASLGLAAAHEQGLVHRDIKPSNLLLSQQCQLKVLDLGLAKSFSDDASSIQLTQAGRIVGTPDFMAPEQWDSSGAVDARTDLYALGCTLYYLLTGRTPFRTDSRSSLREIMTAHMLHPPPSLTELRPDVPAELDELYRRLMAKSPEGRIGSAQELARLLDSIARRLGGTAAVDPSFLSVLGDAETEVDRPRTTQQQEIKDAALSGRRHPTRDLIVAAVVCVAILFVACVAGFLLWAAVKLLLR